MKPSTMDMITFAWAGVCVFCFIGFAFLGNILLTIVWGFNTGVTALSIAFILDRWKVSQLTHEERKTSVLRGESAEPHDSGEADTEQGEKKE